MLSVQHVFYSYLWNGSIHKFSLKTIWITWIAPTNVANAADSSRSVRLPVGRRDMFISRRQMTQTPNIRKKCHMNMRIAASGHMGRNDMVCGLRCLLLLLCCCFFFCQRGPGEQAPGDGFTWACAACAARCWFPLEAWLLHNSTTFQARWLLPPHKQICRHFYSGPPVRVVLNKDIFSYLFSY